MSLGTHRGKMGHGLDQPLSEIGCLTLISLRFGQTLGIVTFVEDENTERFGAQRYILRPMEGCTSSPGLCYTSLSLRGR